MPWNASRHTADLCDHLRTAIDGGLPLASALRAAAAESPSRRAARTWSELAAAVEAGTPWQELLASNSHGLPAHLVGIVQAGLASGDLVSALDRWIEQQRTTADLRRQLVWSLCYPLSVLVGAMALCLLVSVAVAGPVEVLARDFGTELPAATRLALLANRLNLLLIPVAAFGIPSALGLVRLIGGAAVYTRVISAIPLFGPLVLWSGVAEMCWLLRLYLSQRMPLPDALTLTARGVANADLSQVAHWLARGTRDGIPLGDLIEATARLPTSLAPIVRWGQTTGTLEEAFATAAEMFDGRARLRASLVTVIVPPLITILVVGGLLLAVMALLLPMISLIQNLS